MRSGCFFKLRFKQYFSIVDNARSLVAVSSDRSLDMDVWRTLAMSLVYIFHCFFYARYSYTASQFESFYTETPIFMKWVWSGDRGVDIFFVISGYLIGRLLILEYVNEGAIQLRRFYSRRIFRLMPVYLLAMITRIQKRSA